MKYICLLLPLLLLINAIATVSSSVSSVSYTANGTTDTFATTFSFFDNDELVVTVTNLLGTTTTQTLTTDYTVSGGDGSTGSITFISPPTNNYTVFIKRVTSVSQELDLEQAGELSSQELENALDKLIFLIQETQRDFSLDRAITSPVSESPDFELPVASSRSGKYLSFDSSGNVSLTSSISLGTAKGAWATATSYVVGDLVYDSLNTNKLYYVKTDYISGATLAGDVTNNNLVLLITAPVATTIQHNYTATVAPTATDDTNAGYEKGSDWINTVSGIVYKCVDATASSAVWKDLSTDTTGTGVSVGTMIWFPAETAPSGYLQCDGSAVSKSTYASLYTVLQDGGGVCIYGESGSNFNLPDARGRFIRMFDDTAGNDPDASSRTNRGDGTTGDEVGTLQSYANASHDHGGGGTTGNAGSHSHTGSTSTGGSHTHSATASEDSTHTHDIHYNSITVQSGSGTTFWEVDTNPGGSGSTPSGSASSSITVNVVSGGSHSHSFTTSTSSDHNHSYTIPSAGGNESRPSNIYFNLFIKY